MVSLNHNELIITDAMQTWVRHRYQPTCCSLISLKFIIETYGPDSNVYGANMGPIWGPQDPGGPHVGPMNFAIWEGFSIHHPLNQLLLYRTLHPLMLSDAYMRQLTQQTLFMIITSQILYAKQISKPMLTYCKLNYWEHISIKIEHKYNDFSYNNCIWKFHLQNGGHFVSINMLIVIQNPRVICYGSFINKETGCHYLYWLMINGDDLCSVHGNSIRMETY